MTPFNHAMSFTITINVSYTPPLTTKTKAEMHEHALGIYVNHLHHLTFNLVQSRASKGQKANGVADRLAKEGVISQSLSICYDSSYQFYLWPFFSFRTWLQSCYCWFWSVFGLGNCSCPHYMSTV